MSGYRRWSIRLPSSTLIELAKIALDDGWQLSDLVRTLVVLGASANWLGLEEMEEGLRRLDELGKISETLGTMMPLTGGRRPYAPRASQETEVVTLILPDAIAQMIESYAGAHRFSRNGLCDKLLTEGLMIYLTGERNLLQALADIGKVPDA